MTDSALTDHALDIIVALLPLSAVMVVVQVNPYHALVVRGILGAIAALVYVVFGAADVALTEALVGTMLAITLYAVAVRSSLVMRLGVLEPELEENTTQVACEDASLYPLPQMQQVLGSMLDRYHLRLEPVLYPDQQALQQALRAKDVHAICVPLGRSPHALPPTSPVPPLQLIVRIQRLYDILKADVTSEAIALTYLNEQGENASSFPTPHTLFPECLEEKS